MAQKPQSDHRRSDGVSRFAGSLLELIDRTEYERVGPNDQFHPVYRLRYEAYRREDFVPINSQGVVRDEFDDLPNAYCYAVYVDGNLVSSVRFHKLTPDNRISPSHSVFGEILDPILDKGHTIIDPSRFTADYEASLALPALPFLTLRIPTIAALHYSAKYLLNAVRPEHGAFYKRVYRSVALSEPRYYPGLSFPMVLYGSDLLPIFDDLVRRYPFFRSTEKERRLLFAAEVQETPGQTVRGRAPKELADALTSRPGGSVPDDALATLFDLPTTMLAEALDIKPEYLIALKESERRDDHRPDYRQEMLEIIALLTKWTNDEEEAASRYRAERIPAFGDRTLESVVKSGRAELAREYLDHLSMGGFA